LRRKSIKPISAAAMTAMIPMKVQDVIQVGSESSHLNMGRTLSSVQEVKVIDKTAWGFPPLCTSRARIPGHLALADRGANLRSVLPIQRVDCKRPVAKIGFRVD
jgi:hypothetical protein